jgi:hypothetical protein
MKAARARTIAVRIPKTFAMGFFKVSFEFRVGRE